MDQKDKNTSEIEHMKDDLTPPVTPQSENENRRFRKTAMALGICLLIVVIAMVLGPKIIAELNSEWWKALF
jgi:hypothetical protein